MQAPQAQKYPIFNQSYEIIKVLGEGGTAKVYLGRSIETGESVAIKIFKEKYLRHSTGSIAAV